MTVTGNKVGSSHTGIRIENSYGDNSTERSLVANNMVNSNQIDDINEKELLG